MQAPSDCGTAASSQSRQNSSAVGLYFDRYCHCRLMPPKARIGDVHRQAHFGRVGAKETAARLAAAHDCALAGRIARPACRSSIRKQQSPKRRRGDASFRPPKCVMTRILHACSCAQTLCADHAYRCHRHIRQNRLNRKNWYDRQTLAEDLAVRAKKAASGDAAFWCAAIPEDLRSHIHLTGLILLSTARVTVSGSPGIITITSSIISASSCGIPRSGWITNLAERVVMISGV